MLDTITLSLRLWGYTLLTLIVLYFFGLIVLGFMAGFGAVALFGMAGAVTFIGSLPALVVVALLLPLLRATNYSREGTLAMALLLVTLVCGIPAFIATKIFMYGGSWLRNAELLVFPAAALLASWIATIRQQESIYRYATQKRQAAETFSGFSEKINQETQRV